MFHYALALRAGCFRFDEMGYLPLDDLGATIFLPTSQRPLRTRQHHSHFEQKLYGEWGSIWRSDYRNRDS
jgi:hypothetical protein